MPKLFKCKIELVRADDRPLWIKKDEFMSCVDGHDLACRGSRGIVDAYHLEWFHVDADGIETFAPPSFYLKGTHAMFINGRHRTLVLAKHLTLLPMLLTSVDNASLPTLSNIVDREISMDEYISLPDLPKFDLGNS